MFAIWSGDQQPNQRDEEWGNNAKPPQEIPKKAGNPREGTTLRLANERITPQLGRSPETNPWRCPNSCERASSPHRNRYAPTFLRIGSALRSTIARVRAGYHYFSRYGFPTGRVRRATPDRRCVLQAGARATGVYRTLPPHPPTVPYISDILQDMDLYQVRYVYYVLFTGGGRVRNYPDTIRPPPRWAPDGRYRSRDIVCLPILLPIPYHTSRLPKRIGRHRIRYNS